MNEDERLAKSLQDMEFQEAQRRNDRQAVEDEEFARRLAREDLQRSRTTINRGYGTLAIQPGEKTAVRLFHPFTRSSIGESVYVHYLDRATMLFELVGARRKFLRIRPDGIADFADVSPTDPAATFVFEVLNGGRMHLKNLSASRGFGKYLILINGQLRGDGDQNHHSEWILLAANALPPINVNPPSQPVQAPPSQAPPSSPRPQDATSRESAVLPAGYFSVSQNEDDHFEAINPMIASTRSKPKPQHTATQAELPPQQSPSVASNLFYISQSFSPQVGSVADTPPSTETNTPDQIIQWLTTTPHGREALNSPEYQSVKRLLNEGILINILNRPDWVSLSARYQDFQKGPLPYDEKISKRGLPDVAMRCFFEQGYVILDKVIGTEDLLLAKRYSNHYILSKPSAVTKHGHYYGEVNLTGPIEHDFDILRLFYSTPVVDIVQRLLGPGDIQKPKYAKICVQPPSIGESYSRITQQQKRWRVEGFTHLGNQAAHSLIVGIALSDFLADNEGNFCVYPRSHEFIHEHIKTDVRAKRAMFSDAAPAAEKPDLGLPKQIHMRAGDVVLYTSKLATQISANLSADFKTMVFFQIVHVDYTVLKDPSMDGVAGVWVEFKGVDILDKPSDLDDLPECPTSDDMIKFEPFDSEGLPTITSSAEP